MATIYTFLDLPSKENRDRDNLSLLELQPKESRDQSNLSLLELQLKRAERSTIYHGTWLKRTEIATIYRYWATTKEQRSRQFICSYNKQREQRDRDRFIVNLATS
ncbi:hypothetical protein AVEN_118844-1 [Araneus ventricosus]|uniref:Uncharacterized protein n=1 Tax=Araneus ventricosus TaxID=182803 RepID=A0A4Y2CH07_ARAVE|nr:hypothetical protein AVEN_118844-1 [Araneus ventricosus]